MQTKRLTRRDAMLILGIDRQTTSEIVTGRCSDTELLSRYELLHRLVAGRTAGVMTNMNPEEDIRVKIAREREARNSRIKAARRANAARLAGLMA